MRDERGLPKSLPVTVGSQLHLKSVCRNSKPELGGKSMGQVANFGSEGAYGCTRVDMSRYIRRCLAMQGPVCDGENLKLYPVTLREPEEGSKECQFDFVKTWQQHSEMALNMAEQTYTGRKKG